jgi:predicted nucleic acid-binding protein
MPDIIVNTSPLQYLFQLGKIELLHTIYGDILVPFNVKEEIDAGRILQINLPNIENYSWMKIVKSSNIGLISFPSILGKGEKEGIAVTLERPGSTFILDDMNARKFATVLGIKITGTLGILLKAKEQKYLSSIRPYLDKMIELGFRIHPNTYQSMLELANEKE